jgi:hypothetical protein
MVIETQGLSSKQNAEPNFVGQCYNPTENGVKADAI